MAEPLVLAIEPDLRQAAIVKRIVKEKALADVAVVDSLDAAIEMMRTTMPDVLLLSALLSPRDEDELITHLKTLDNAGHLQTHTIPQLASALGPGEGRASRGLLSAFRRKKDPEPIHAGCDPDLFAEEIRVFLQRAADKKRDLQNTDRAAPDMRPSAVKSTRAAAEQTEPQADEPSSSSSWSSPFEWKPASTSARAARRAPDPAPVAKAPERPAPLVSEPIGAGAGPLVDNFTASRSFLPDDAGPAPTAAPLVRPPVPEPVVVARVPEPIVVAPLIPEPTITIPAPEPIVVVAPRAPEPAPVTIPAPAPIAPPIAPIAAEPIAPPPPVVAPAPVPAPAPVAAKPPAPAPVPVPVPVAAKPPAPEPVRLKPVAERAAQITARVQLQELGRAARAAKERAAEDRLGPLARWARIETPRPTRSAPVTSDDVRTLIASLAVPTAIASVRYPRGCRIRRVRVPASPDVDSSEVGPVILSRRALAEQREKQASP